MNIPSNIQIANAKVGRKEPNQAKSLLHIKKGFAEKRFSIECKNLHSRERRLSSSIVASRSDYRIRELALLVEDTTSGNLLMCVHVCLFFSEEPRQWSEAFHILNRVLFPRFFSCQKVTPRCKWIFQARYRLQMQKQEDKKRTEGNHFFTSSRVLLRSVSQWSVRTCTAERASWVRQQLYRYRITDASFWKLQTHKDA